MRSRSLAARSQLWHWQAMPSQPVNARSVLALTLGLGVVAALAALAPHNTEPRLEPEVAPIAATPPPERASEGTHDPGAGDPATSQRTVFSGRVEEIIDVPSYTYLRLATPSGEVWTAISTTQIGRGTSVRVASQVEMRDFESKTLGRTFATIHFGELVDASSMGSANPHGSDTAYVPGAVPPHPVAAASATIDVGVVEAASGPDARTIAEIYEQRGALVGKHVTVRGRVVKLTQGVLGKNYLHVQDGSGSKARGDDDLTLTTQAAPGLGEIVTLRGVVAVDKDIGVGYQYPLIVEDAQVVR